MQTKENKMGVMPIDKLLISMSLPAHIPHKTGCIPSERTLLSCDKHFLYYHTLSPPEKQVAGKADALPAICSIKGLAYFTLWMTSSRVPSR